tara:strand:- start:1097 stop:1426 length:330 start_codon:yes stop_codon:yes gene_type:complete
MINIEFKCLYQVRFETLQYGDPVFNTLVQDPLEIQFSGGAIGIHQTFFNTDIANSISAKCNIQQPHYFYIGDQWQYVNASRNYNLNEYNYIWFSSFNTNTFNLTEIDYA